MANAGQSSQGSTEPWDTAFNRATNIFKDRDVDLPLTSAGRVSGFGLNMKVAEYYDSSDAKSRKERRTTSKDKAEVQELKKKVDLLEQAKVDSSTVDKLVENMVKERLREFIPPRLLEGIAAWNAKGQKGPIHVPSFTGSNSSRNRPESPDMVTPPQLVAPTQPPLQLENDRLAAEDDRLAVLDNAPKQPENDGPAAGTAARVSTLAELDAITKVTN